MKIEKRENGFPTDSLIVELEETDVIYGVLTIPEGVSLDADKMAGIGEPSTYVQMRGAIYLGEPDAEQLTELETRKKHVLKQREKFREKVEFLRGAKIVFPEGYVSTHWVEGVLPCEEMIFGDNSRLQVNDAGEYPAIPTTLKRLTVGKNCWMIANTFSFDMKHRGEYNLEEINIGSNSRIRGNGVCVASKTLTIELPIDMDEKSNLRFKEQINIKFGERVHSLKVPTDYVGDVHGTVFGVKKGVAGVIFHREHSQDNDWNEYISQSDKWNEEPKEFWINKNGILEIGRLDANADFPHIQSVLVGEEPLSRKTTRVTAHFTER